MKLKILTWNIAWAYGLGSDGSDYQPLPQAHFEDSLDAMSELIRNLDVDIVLIQEVDFYARRSHYLPELDILSRKSGLIYRDAEVSWDHPYVPFPGLSPSGQFGRVKSGGGILSRYPIKRIFSEQLPKPRENGGLYNWFYLNRYLQIVEIEGLRLCNLHLEVFSKENRELHLVKLQNRLIDYGIDLAGGDFNGAISLSPEIEAYYEAHSAIEPTFPSSAPTEALDGFILKKGRFQNVNLSTVNSGSVSDHFAFLFEADSAIFK
jgi:endonuclease/exonuclease/phosphatase family metal-dependent hydrolase